MSVSMEFFFDVASPYSYLAAARLEALAGSGPAVVWRPFLLGGVFRSTGNRAPALVPAKGRYLFADVRRWATQDGVPLQWPALFPINSLVAQRALTAAEAQGGQAAVRALAMALYEAYWGRGEDPCSEPVLRSAADAAGLDAAALGAAIVDPEIKGRLRAVTDEAVARGAFGAPTFFVGEQMFFGRDRLDWALDAAQ